MRLKSCQQIFGSISKIDGKGKDGIKTSSLKDRYQRWLVRTLIKLEALKVIPGSVEQNPKAGKASAKSALRAQKAKPELPKIAGAA